MPQGKPRETTAVYWEHAANTSEALTDFSGHEIEFDEVWYLEKYPDVAQAVQNGDLPSGRVHYLRYGRDEERLGFAFDPDWYAATYPLVAAEAGDADPLVLRQHYLNAGRFRGYLAHPNSNRPKNPAGIASAYGGLWIDQANARDMIAGRLETGAISAEDAALLTAFVNDGYVKLPEPLPAALLDRAEEVLEAAYSGGLRENLLFECHAVSPGYCSWSNRVRDEAAKVLDLHWWSADIRQVIFSDSIAHFLHLIFDRPALASQTLGFYRGSGQPYHQDSAYVPYSLPLQFAATWIALEDVMEGAGELQYWAGSHKALPEYIYPGDYRSAFESQRHLGDPPLVSAAVQAHEKQIVELARGRELKREAFLAKRGEVLFWHADLAHGGAPISGSRTRKSIVTHYCPKEVAPLYFETVGQRSVRKHGRCCYYSSGIYSEAASDPEPV